MSPRVERVRHAGRGDDDAIAVDDHAPRRAREAERARLALADDDERRPREHARGQRDGDEIDGDARRAERQRAEEPRRRPGCLARATDPRDADALPSNERAAIAGSSSVGAVVTPEASQPRPLRTRRATSPRGGSTAAARLPRARGRRMEAAVRAPVGTEERAFAVAAHVVALALFAAFWLPALARTSGDPPLPLDDVMIHFGFARSLALGHPMEWIPGNGFSSGATSLLYPALLAPAWLVGARGLALGWAAGALGVVCTADAMRSLFALGRGAPPWLRWTAPLAVVCVPFVDWSLCSGMETALFAAVLGRSVRALARVEASAPAARPRAELGAGLWFAALVATRPEGAAFVAPLVVAVAHAAGAGSALLAFARAAAPTCVLLGAQAAANVAFTGEPLAAGAVRKLVETNPYASRVEVALEVVKNAAALREQAIAFAFGGGFMALAPFALVALGVASRRARRSVAALASGGAASLAIVCLNATARFQNLRYAAPAALGLLFAASIGASAASRARRRPVRAAVAALGLVALFVGPARVFPAQIEHLLPRARTCTISRCRRRGGLARESPRPRRLFVNDAGALAYVSELPAIDGLGLGGFRGLPFARASVHGPAAVVELVERLAPRDRPDVLAVYPAWWRGLADVFGVRVWSITLHDNVICGADELVVLRADWSTLATPGDPPPFAGIVDELDVADLVSEGAHAFDFDAPHAGWVFGAAHANELGARRWDGGRAFSQGTGASFRVADHVARGSFRLVVRTEPMGDLELRAQIERRGSIASEARVRSSAEPNDAWRDVVLELADVGAGDRIRLEPVTGELRVVHAWLVRP